MPRLDRIRRWLALGATGLIAVLVAAVLIWRGDILEALLDPKLPYAVYKPPPAPNYAQTSAWALLSTTRGAGDRAVDIFFVHPTTFDGGKDWNGPITDGKAAGVLTQVMIPNYAAPFSATGRVFAPRYRQASLYTSLTLFDDAIEARQFAYGDVRAAFSAFERRIGPGRPFIIVGVEQGGVLAARLLAQDIAPDPVLRRNLVAAYLIDTAVPAADYRVGALLPACSRRDQSDCVVAWIAAPRLDFIRVQRILHRSLVWSADGRLVPLEGRAILCVNPLLGSASDADAPARLNLGAANATGLEWGVRPGFMVRQVGAQCIGGVLRVSRPRSTSLLPAGGWAERLRAPGYNLFWADLEADSLARARAWLAQARLAVQPTSPSAAPGRQSKSS